MRLSRMTTRQWMIAVAVVAVGVGAGMLIVRSRSYAALAALHAESEKECRRIVEADEGNRLDPAIWKDWIAYARRGRTRLLYHAALRRKYERASRRPWLPVEPDPPEPDPLVVDHGWRGPVEVGTMAGRGTGDPEKRVAKRPERRPCHAIASRAVHRAADDGRDRGAGDRPRLHDRSDPSEATARRVPEYGSGARTRRAVQSGYGAVRPPAGGPGRIRSQVVGIPLPRPG